MTYEIGLFAEEVWADERSWNWDLRLESLQDQIESAFNNHNMSHDVTVEGYFTCSVGDPYNQPMYDSGGLHDANAADFDEWLNTTSAVTPADDANLLITKGTGGAMGFSSYCGNANNICLVGGASLEANKPIEIVDPGAHYHDCYNALHEIAHALDAPVGGGRPEHGDADRACSTCYTIRTPTQTTWSKYNECGNWIPSDKTPVKWRLQYTDCVASEFNDESNVC